MIKQNTYCDTDGTCIESTMNTPATVSFDLKEFQIDQLKQENKHLREIIHAVETIMQCKILED